jgi:hypothetical protein
VRKSSTKGALLLRNVPRALHARLVASARANRRTLSNEALTWLEERLRGIRG